VEELASRVGTTRAVLAERFDRFLGEPVLTYHARWRLQLAARMLQTSGKRIGQIAADVGYTSQAAFNRAFRRQFDMAPVQYRRQGRG
jgi:AraC-like DNA-binding protein